MSSRNSQFLPDILESFGSLGSGGYSSAELLFSSLFKPPETVECAKTQAAEREQELLREKQKEEDQKMEAQQRSLQENIDQLKEKMDKERESHLRQQETMLEHKLKVSPMGLGRT